MEKCVYSLIVLSEPKAQPRPRKGKYGNFYSNPADIEAWKETIKTPIIVKLWFYFHRDNNIGNDPHTAKPDIDNLVKPVLDALKGIEVFKDDGQVYKVFAQKYWTHGKSGMKLVVISEA